VLVYEIGVAVSKEDFTMYVGLAVAVVMAGLVWYLSPKIGVDVRGRISITAIAVGAVFGSTSGFIYSNIAGLGVLSAFLVGIGILFGYERE
jgi:hypothetical protein